MTDHHIHLDELDEISLAAGDRVLFNRGKEYAGLVIRATVPGVFYGYYGEADHGPVIAGASIKADGITLDGLAIKDSLKNGIVAGFCKDLKVANTTVEGSSANGIWLNRVTGAVLKGCSFLKNGHGEKFDRQSIGVWNSTSVKILDTVIEHDGKGMCMEFGGQLGHLMDVDMVGCDIDNSKGNKKHTLSVYGGALHFERNTLIGNAESAAILVVDATSPSRPIEVHISDSKITGGYRGVTLYSETGKPTHSESYAVVRNCIIRDCRIGMRVKPEWTTMDDAIEINHNLYERCGLSWSNKNCDFEEWQKISGQDKNSVYKEG